MSAIEEKLREPNLSKPDKQTLEEEKRKLVLTSQALAESIEAQKMPIDRLRTEISSHEVTLHGEKKDPNILSYFNIFN